MMNSKQIVFLVVSVIILYFRAILADDQEELNLFTCLNSSSNCANETIALDGEIESDTKMDDVRVEALTTNLLKHSQSNKNLVGAKKLESTLEKHNPLKRKKNKYSKQGYCICDLTLATCDINCCCDEDCTVSDKKMFTFCEDNSVENELDGWYCSQKPFFRKNDTRFILEKIADSLFCIASDNVPPTYASTHVVQNIKDEKDLKAVMKSKTVQFKWKLDIKKIKNSEFNASKIYKYKDAIWRIGKDSIQPIELPSSGFGESCEFKKTVKFLEDWKGACVQSLLDNKNDFLFPSNLTNFSIIAIPSRLNLTSLKNCPNDVCRPFNTSYCLDSWTFCRATSKKDEYCSEFSCFNVAKHVRYVLLHNGSEGILDARAYVQTANVSGPFEQSFEIIFEWVHLENVSHYERRNVSGYLPGNPVPVGTMLSSNKTNNKDSEQKKVSFDPKHEYFTLPVAGKSGMCHDTERHTVRFAENVKLKCSILLTSQNFSTSTCIKLQNETFRILMNFVNESFERNDFYKLLISKSGNVTDKSTKSWIEVFADLTVPENVIKGQILDNEIQCSGLINSVMFRLVHSLITTKNHEILAVEMAFGQEVDLKWPKCKGPNCKDILFLDLTTFVTFNDVTKPTKFHFAGGPNLDISLPYDFFYPFITHYNSRNSGNFLSYKTLTQFFLIITGITTKYCIIDVY